MPLHVLQASSLASGEHNEDRFGAAGALAWVIDGATDVVETPLTPAPSDAAWLAHTLDAALARLGTHPPDDLAHVPDMLAETAAAAFNAAARRPPRHRGEHPSAAGLVVRATADGLDYVSIGDCTLIADGPQGTTVIGVSPDQAGDTWIASAVASFHERQEHATAEAARAHVWPRIRAVREFMNEPDGYGVFSITPTPTHFVRKGSVSLHGGGMALLASDGLMRLVDVFCAYDAAGLLAAARHNGLEVLMTELRRRENEDMNCKRYPRAKIADDATGVLLAIT